MGEGPENIIQIRTDLEKDKGDKVNIDLEVPMSGAGVGDDGVTTGYEEAITVQNMEIAVHERAHAVVSNGAMSEKRTVTNIRDAAKRGLGIWTRDVCLEPDINAGLYGLYNASGIETVNEHVPTSSRLVYGGQSVAGVVSAAAMTTDATLTAETAASTLCGLQFLSAIKRKAIMATPKIRPLNIGGLRVFLVLLHPYQVKAIKQSTGEQAFTAMLKDADVKGKGNPILSGGPFYYDGMFIQEYDRAPLRTGAGGTTPAEGFWLASNKLTTSDAVANTRSVAAGLLLGCQAGVFLWGKRPTWSEDMVDNDKPKVKVDMIYGVKKTLFNAHGGTAAQQDYGVIQFHNQVVVD
jgi:N4-gp56 family major capsid protein